MTTPVPDQQTRTKVHDSIVKDSRLSVNYIFEKLEILAGINEELFGYLSPNAV